MNFSIKSLFGDDDQLNFTGKLDINTLFKQDNSEFNSKILIQQKRKSKERIKKYYTQIYKNCCAIIVSANKLGCDETYFHVCPFSDQIDYSVDECIEYIQKELEKIGFKVTILDNFIIQILWKDSNEIINNKK
jgi:hypothetical protein